MASCFSWLGLLSNLSPYRLASLFMGFAACLLTLTMVPPSSVVYLIRADYSSNNADAIPSTTWFGTLGYCLANGNDNILSSRHSSVECSAATLGYDVAAALTQEGNLMVAIPETPLLSIFMTRPPIVLNPIAIALCLLSIMAYQIIPLRPKGITYSVAMGGSLVALFVSSIAFIFEIGFVSYIEERHPVEGAQFTTRYGPVAHAIILSFVSQLAACVVGFYSCIGGKYHCEGGIQLEDGRMSDIEVPSGVRLDECEYIQEKCPIQD
ncbi:hypothetical protein F5Y19DRAFT_473611 [Xylariaceae sp. FL1651]|nr:hypothetical protein F5Y19DRAFT_473611 [Xylariaceae sp. FL1651]